MGFIRALIFLTTLSSAVRERRMPPEWRGYMCNRRTPEPRSLLVLHCHAKGHPKPSITWYKNDKRISSSSHEVKVKGSSLTFPSFTRQNEGKWKCEATNKLGSISHTFDVYAADEKSHEGSGSYDPDLRSAPLPFDPLIGDPLSSSASSYGNPLQDALAKLNSFNERYGLGSFSTPSLTSEKDLQINTEDSFFDDSDLIPVDFFDSSSLSSKRETTMAPIMDLEFRSAEKDFEELKKDDSEEGSGETKPLSQEVVDEVVDEDYSSSYDPVEAIPVDFIPDSIRGQIPTYSDEEIVEESFSFSSEVNEALDDLLAGTDLIEHDLVPEFIKATAKSIITAQTTTAPFTKTTSSKIAFKTPSFIVPERPDVLVPDSGLEPSAEGLVKGPRIIEEPKSTISKWNKSVHMVCKVKGDPMPEIYWIRNDKQISSADDPNLYEFSRNGESTLYLRRPLLESPMGKDKFNCVGRNRYGIVKSRTAYLEVDRDQ
ncbi:Oidioi.mRNA.OKI2018_I69.chr2.g6277.t1.cds [Oikopleura dioica]|uniref:Oidioi.mRNA.OKI2018_I69.chr2.g6277.t1.cds n=1 Tax=Oikopleura dioica TaxID=34765 RepID=A0ABN7T332_OIKDI|nr:Oidioi.mRNA.OKI2018_I69.chr2.g6277.t1.cds [Oikopleura dioica]